MRMLWFIPLFLFAAETAQAAEYKGELKRVSSTGEGLCIPLEASSSPLLKQICLKRLMVKWAFQNHGAAPTMRAQIRWELSDTLHPRNGGERDLSSYPHTFQSAYKSLRLSDLHLAAFIYPGLHSAPDNFLSNTDNLGVGINFSSASLGSSGEAYSFSEPQGLDWGHLFVDAPGYSACKDTAPVYLPEDVAKGLVRDGLDMSGLRICSAAAKGAEILTAALAKPEPTKKDEGLSFDDLLAGADREASTVPAIETAPTDAVADLDVLLDGVEDALAENERQREIQRVEEARQKVIAEAEAEQKRCLSRAEGIDRAVEHFIEDMEDQGEPAIGDGWEFGGGCQHAFEQMEDVVDSVSSFGPGIYISGNSIYGSMARISEDFGFCIAYRRDAIKELRRDVAAIDLEGCAFEGGDPKQDIEPVIEAVESEHAALRRAAQHALSLDAKFKRGGQESMAAMTRSIWGGSNGGSVMDLGKGFSHESPVYESYKAQRSERKLKPRPAPSFSYPKPGQARGQTNAPMVIDNGTLCNQVNAAERNACLAANKPKPAPRAASKGKCGYETCAKTQ